MMIILPGKSGSLPRPNVNEMNPSEKEYFLFLCENDDDDTQ